MSRPVDDGGYREANEFRNASAAHVNYIAQLRRSVCYADALIAYAKSIGCQVVHDEITTNSRQARLISKWLMEHPL